jgi:putative transcriptional regulator
MNALVQGESAGKCRVIADAQVSAEPHQGGARIRAAHVKIPLMDSQNFTHHFLIAMPQLADPNFSGTLTYLCEHNEHGAIGLVINRPSSTTVSALLSNIEIPITHLSQGEQIILNGGPVQRNRGFVLHAPKGAWTSTLEVAEEIAMTTSKDILEAVARGDGPSELVITMGYAGWSAGQLEEEIAQNAWLTVRANPEVIFRTPIEKRFEAALALLGIKPHQLSAVAGHG